MFQQSFYNVRYIGGLGSILMMISFILLFFSPMISLVSYLIGLMLILIALKHISDYVKDKKIFTYALYSASVFILAIIIVFSMLMSIISILMSPLRLLETILNISSFTLGIVTSLFIVWILIIISSAFLKLSFDKISRSLKIDLFSITALLYLIGAILIIFVIGSIFIFVAQILQTIAFFSIKF